MSQSLPLGGHMGNQILPGTCLLILMSEQAYFGNILQDHTTQLTSSLLSWPIIIICQSCVLGVESA